MSNNNTSRNNIYKILNYEQFQVETIKGLKESLNKDYKVELNHVMKNNSVELVAITITTDEEKVVPNIYLENYYWNYMEGSTIDDIVYDIIDKYFEHLEKGMVYSEREEFLWKNVKDGIFYRVINREKNKELLEQVPHLLYLDLAITFYFIVTESNKGLAVARITKEVMKEWGIKLKELRDTAMENTPNLFPVHIQNMNEAILELLDKDWSSFEMNTNSYDSNTDWTDDLYSQLLFNVQYDENPIYIMTNVRGVNGASCILYKEVLYEFAHEIDSDLYILPSSIHEVILVKDDGYIQKEDLIEMVMDVNESEVDDEDYLSNQVYHYNRYKNMITL